MKITIYILLLALVACSSNSTKQSASSSAPDVNAEAFKKESPLKSSEVNDFYSSVGSSQSPALLDETLDRMTPDELKNLKTSNDPLTEMSILCSQKDFKEAFAVSSRTYNKYQKIPAYWNVIGSCHLNQGSFRKALLFYNKSLEVSPGYVPALNNIGVLYSRQGEDQKALIAFERANKQSKFSKTPRYNLARLYLKYGLAELALPLFQGLLSESQQDIDLVYATGSSYFILSDYQKALSYYDQIPKKYLEYPEIGLNVALTLKKVGKSQEAKSVFNAIKTPKTKDLQDYHTRVGEQVGINL